MNLRLWLRFLLAVTSLWAVVVLSAVSECRGGETHPGLFVIAYTVKAGDTAKSIAAKFRTTVVDLRALNPGVDFSAMKAGTRIRVAAPQRVYKEVTPGLTVAENATPATVAPGESAKGRPRDPAKKPTRKGNPPSPRTTAPGSRSGGGKQIAPPGSILTSPGGLLGILFGIILLVAKMLGWLPEPRYHESPPPGEPRHYEPPPPGEPWRPVEDGTERDAIKKGGKLYLLAVSVSTYRHNNSLRGHRAAAQKLCGLFMKQNQSARRPYHEVVVNALFDEDATRSRILAGIRDFLGQARNGDTAILYIAGHGGTADGYTYYCWDSGPTSESSIPLKEIRHALKTVKRRGVTLVVLNETCYSGSLRPDGTSPGEPVALEDIFGDKVFILSASCPAEVSWDEVYTDAVIEGLSGRADAEKDGYVSWHQLVHYVSKRVPTLAARVGRTQTPYSRNAGSDFPLVSVG